MIEREGSGQPTSVIGRVKDKADVAVILLGGLFECLANDFWLDNESRLGLVAVGTLFLRFL